MLINKEFTILLVKVIPKSSANKISVVGIGSEGLSLKVHLTTVPEKGKANEALIKLLSKTLGVSKSQVELVKGHTNNKKVIKLCGITSKELLMKFEGL